MLDGNFFPTRFLDSVWNKVFASGLATMVKKPSSGKDWHNNLSWQSTKVSSLNPIPSLTDIVRNNNVSQSQCTGKDCTQKIAGYTVK